MEKFHELQNLIAYERKNHLLAYACGDSGILLTEHQTQCDNIRYLLTWAEGEIWVIQRTSGNDTNLFLSRVVKLVLHVLVGSVIPLMQLMQPEHTFPFRVTKYDNGMLIRHVLDTATYGTCRDYAAGRIEFNLLKADLLLPERRGSRGTANDVNDHNGRVGNSCVKCLDKFPDAFLSRTGRVKKRRVKPRKKN